MAQAANHSTPETASVLDRIACAIRDPSPSRFDNLSTADLIDELGQVKAEGAEIEAREKALKAELVARKIISAEGALFRATVSESLRETLDMAMVRAEMGAAWCSARSKIGIVTTVRVSARTGSRKAA